MFIAHIPAGYLLGKGVKSRALGARAVMSAALIGSLAPDLDLIYFYTIDACRHHHHSYWTHYPVVWLGLMLLSWGIGKIPAMRSIGSWSLIFSLSALIHLLLDCVVGDVPLLAPWSMDFYALSTVPAVVQPWWLNFLIHWSFLLELAIIFTAGWLLFKKKA